MDLDGKHFGNKIGGKQNTDACLVVTDDDGDREIGRQQVRSAFEFDAIMSARTEGRKYAGA